MNNIMKILNFLLIIIEIKMYINIMKYGKYIVYVLLLVLIAYIIVNTYTKNIESFSQKTIKENVVCNPSDGKTLRGLRKHHLGISQEKTFPKMLQQMLKDNGKKITIRTVL